MAANSKSAPKQAALPLPARKTWAGSSRKATGMKKVIFLRASAIYRPLPGPVLLQAAGLAKANGSTLKLTNKGKKALKGHLPQIIKDTWDKWYTSKFLDEFSRVEQIKGQKSTRGRTLVASLTRRPILYSGLLLCAPGRWLTVKELIRAMNSEGLDFEVARYAWKLYVGDSQYGHLDEYGDQAMVKTRYMLAFLFEYAATLGIIDVAYIHPGGALSDYPKWDWGMDDTTFLSRYDGLMYIRLNSL